MKEANTEFHLRDYIYQHLGFDPKGMWVMPVTKDRQEGFQNNVASYLDSFKTLQKDIAQFHQQFPKVTIDINRKEEFNYTAATPEEIRATLSVLRHELSKYPENYTKSLQFYCNIGKGTESLHDPNGTSLTLPVNQGHGPTRLAIHDTIAVQLGIPDNGSLYTAIRLHFPGPLTTMLKESELYDGIRPTIHALTGCTYRKIGNTYLFIDNPYLQKNSPYYRTFKFNAAHWNKVLGSASSTPNPATDVPSQQLRTTGSLRSIIDSYKVFQTDGQEQTQQHGPVIQNIFKAQLDAYAQKNPDSKHPLTPVIKDLMTQHGSFVSRIHLLPSDAYKVFWKKNGQENSVEVKQNP